MFFKPVAFEIAAKYPPFYVTLYGELPNLSQERRRHLSDHCVGHPEEGALKLVLQEPQCGEVRGAVRTN